MTTISPGQTPSRPTGIEKVSRIVLLSLQYGIPLLILTPILLLVVLPMYGISAPKDFIMKFLQSAANTSGAAAATAVKPTANHSLQTVNALLPIVSLVMFAFWYRTLRKLFGFFGKGVLFTTETVRCIRNAGRSFHRQPYTARDFEAGLRRSPGPNLNGRNGRSFIGSLDLFHRSVDR